MIKRSGQSNDRQAAHLDEPSPGETDETTAAHQALGTKKAQDRLGRNFAKLWRAQASPTSVMRSMLEPPAACHRGAPDGWGRRWLLVRRSLAAGELAFYTCAAQTGLPRVALVRVAGCRWRVEEAFQTAMGLCGLGQPRCAAGGRGIGG